MGDDRHVVLVGSMGVGKSTVGRLVADELGRPLLDSDALLAAEGEDAAGIARTQGVAALHRRECDELLAALARPEPAVIAAAASVVDAPDCRRALRVPFVAWLRGPPALLAARGAGAPHRRALGAEQSAGLAALQRRRAPLYRAAADIVVDVEGLTPDEVARIVLIAFAAPAG